MAPPDEEDPTVTLEQLAGIVAALEAGEPRDEVLARAGLSLEAWTAARDGWLERLARRATVGDLQLCRRYTELCTSHGAAARRRARRGGKGLSGVIPVAPTPRLVRLVSDRGPGQPVPPAPVALPPIAAPAAAAPPPRARRPVGSTTGDIVLPAAGPRPVTPFQPGPPAAAREAIATPTPAPAPPPAGATSVGRTAPDVSAASLAAPALPFRPAPGPAAEPPARSSLARTMAFDASQLLKAATPFTKAAEAVAPPAAPPRAVASVTLADYAKLCATVRRFPDQVPDIMSRFGFDAASWRALHALWRERLDKDASLKARWETLVERNVSRKTP